MQTASLLEEHATWPAAIEVSAIATSDVETQTKVLREHSAARLLAVVGHEPDLGRLASWLLTGDEAAVAFDWRRGGVLILDSSSFLPADGRLIAHLPPRLLRR